MQHRRQNGVKTSRRKMLDGLAVAIKNNISTTELPTTSSSHMLKEYNSPFDATVVKLLRNSGADIVGKANCDEFGMGSMNLHSIHGAVVNPFVPKVANPGSRHVKRSAGGSSGGSAAAVAAGMCYAALGTDTGGSTRLPASYCGIVGLKPSYGIISRWGVVSFADSLDCVGIFGGDVSAVQNIFNILSVYDERDPTAADVESRMTASRASQERMEQWSDDKGSLEGLRIGIPQEYFPAELAPEILEPVRRTIHGLRSAGATIIPVSLPSSSYALSAYYVIASAEASSNMARYDGVEYGFHVITPYGTDITKASNVYAQTRSVGFGEEVKKRILLGTYALTADAFDNYFLQAQRVRQLVKNDFNKAFAISDYLTNQAPSHSKMGVDVLLHPSAIGIAPPLEGERNDLDAYVQDVLTVPASLAGLPAISVPALVRNDGWPVGVSIVGQWGCDPMVMKVAEYIEKLRD
ncbi:amidase signature enzyme [Pluteus cervinus]|uniref:Amidase signature enzyme n=1 Tax=Pluteus cervinus TaxID=181527 RepID=A0ACD3B0C1_9AGAR|nr:amidase signature enzyme [Pluteus cervinus]